jgi:CheY-like chemotaxis protein
LGITENNPMGNKVILVEDDVNLRETFKELLNIIGFDVLEVYENGGEAYVDLRKKQYDVDIVITDFFMPVMNADEMIKSLKGH